MYSKTRIDLPITSSFYVMAIHTVQDQIIKRIQKYILVDKERTTTETMFVCDDDDVIQEPYGMSIRAN